MRAELGELWDWNHLAANIADLVDLMRFWLDSEYAKWIYDPDSPEAKQAKREKVNPPPHPIVPPTAHRPASVAEEYLTGYLAQLSEHAQKAPATAIESGGKRLVTLAEFDRALGLL